MNSKKVDVLVIGAGPAGTVAASIIHQAGYTVHIVEKLQFPRFVIGESLLPRCMEALDEAGFLDVLKAKGFQEKFGAKFVKGKEICDFSFADQYTNGWDWTWQVPRADFDKTLADCCEANGISVQYETTVTDITFHEDHSITTIEDKEGNHSLIEARFIVDGSGYGRVIPKLLALDRPSNLPPRKAVFAHLRDPNRATSDEPNRITIFILQPGVWAWVIPFSNGRTSVGFVGDPEFFKPFSDSNAAIFDALIQSEPSLSIRFNQVEKIFEPKALESWSATTDTFFGNGYVLTGNVTEFLDPIFSSGVTLATVSSQTAAKLVIKKLRGAVIDWEKEYMEPVMQGVNTFRSYVLAWYDGSLETVFFSKKQEQDIKKQVCSVLAGYVWDETNPFVYDHRNSIKRLVRLINLDKKLS